MCKAIEEMREQVAKEVAKETEEKTTQRNRKEFAQTMLNDGKLPLKTIADYSGLSLEEVLRLKNG